MSLNSQSFFLKCQYWAFCKPFRAFFALVIVATLLPQFVFADEAAFKPGSENICAGFFSKASAEAKLVKFSNVADAVAEIKKEGKKIVTFVGYTGGKYEDANAMLRIAEAELNKLDPANTIINIGASKGGIGAIYKLAKLKGFRTIGIVSSELEKFGNDFSEYADEVYQIQDSTFGGYNDNNILNPTSEVMVQVSDKLIGIGGGPISAAELTEAIRRGIDVLFFPADMNHEIAIARALKSGKPAPTAEYLRGPADPIKNLIRPKSTGP